MVNVFMSGPPASMIDAVNEPLNEFVQTLENTVRCDNYMQVEAMVKNNEVGRLIIFSTVFNFDEQLGFTPGQLAAEFLHRINPDLPILVVGGRKVYVMENYRLKPIEDTSIYIPSMQYSVREANEIMRSFMEGTLDTNSLEVYETLGKDYMDHAVQTGELKLRTES